jgi:hypothetical protein
MFNQKKEVWAAVSTLKEVQILNNEQKGHVVCNELTNLAYALCL